MKMSTEKHTLLCFKRYKIPQEVITTGIAMKVICKYVHQICPALTKARVAKMSEIMSLDTNANLVVLSACETGLGEIKEGEGVYGLRRSFQEAGVKNVINSFWEVSDAGTQLLMTKFYDKFLMGMSARQAMREARLEMLDDVQWSAPFYWSAFVMVGRNT